MGIMSQPKYNKIEFKILNAGVWGLYSSSVHLGPWTFEWNVTRVYTLHSEDNLFNFAFWVAEETPRSKQTVQLMNIL